MNDGLDEWFRWLYCFEDTGELIDPDRLFVERAHPEHFAYDYAGPPRPAPAATVGPPRQRWAPWKRLSRRR